MANDVLALKNEYSLNGYFVIKNFFSQTFISQLINDIENSKSKVLCTLFKQPLSSKKILAGVFTKNGDILDLFESK